jgi:hypothetical protein
MGNKTIEIHFISYLKPRIKDGIVSAKPRSSGLNERKAATLKNVKMPIKIRNRFTTHIMVFGILYLISMNKQNS